jgi:hypothetical protein
MVRQNETQMNLYCVNVEIDKILKFIRKNKEEEGRYDDKRNRMELR